MVIDGQNELVCVHCSSVCVSSAFAFTFQVAKLGIEQAAAALSRGDKDEIKESKQGSGGSGSHGDHHGNMTMPCKDEFLSQWIALVKMNDEQDFRDGVQQALAVTKPTSPAL